MKRGDARATCSSCRTLIVTIIRGSSVRGGQPAKRENSMKKGKAKPQADDLRREYDLSQLRGGVRGKYLERYRAGTNLALLAPDVRAAFPTDEAVNEALRSLMQAQESR
jgi:hypothetical protein